MTKKELKSFLRQHSPVMEKGRLVSFEKFEEEDEGTDLVDVPPGVEGWAERELEDDRAGYPVFRIVVSLNGKPVFQYDPPDEEEDGWPKYNPDLFG